MYTNNTLTFVIQPYQMIIYDKSFFNHEKIAPQIVFIEVVKLKGSNFVCFINYLINLSNLSLIILWGLC